MSTKIHSKESRQTKQHVHTCMFCGQSGSEMSNYDSEQLRRMLSTVIDANYGTSFHHIGDGDGIPPEQAAEIAEWWRLELERIQREYNDQKGE